MYQLPVTNLDRVRKARKAVKNVLSDIGLEDCQNLLKELDGKNAENEAEKDDEEGDPLMGTEWTDFIDGYNGRLRKKWPYRSRTMCCVMCKYSSKNIYHYRSHVARCHEYLQRLCSLTSCQRCYFVAHPRAVKKHILLFHGGRLFDPGAAPPANLPPLAPAPPLSVAAVLHGMERYRCKKCSFPSQSVFTIKKHIILKHMEGVAEHYVGFRHPIAGSNAKLYYCKVCDLNAGNLDQMLHHLLVDPKHYTISTQVQAMIYDNRNKPTPAPRSAPVTNGNGLFVTLPNLAPKQMNSKPFMVTGNGQPGGGTVVALQQLQSATNKAALICGPGSNQSFLPPQASALVQLASAEAKGLLQPGATISLRGSPVAPYPSVKPPPPAAASPQAQQILIPQIRAAAPAQVPPPNQMTLQGTMLTSQSLLSHLIPTGNRVNGMPTYTFAPLQMVPATQSSGKAPEQTAAQAKKWITCPLCNELFPSNVFDVHVEVAHQTKCTPHRAECLAGRAAFLKKLPDKTIKCLTCKALLSEKSVLQHLLHGLSCLYCSILFFSVKQLAEHVKKHDPAGKLYCDFLRQNYKIYTKSGSGIIFPYFDVTAEAPQEILGECEVNLALVTSSLELIYVNLRPSARSEVCPPPVNSHASCCTFCDEKFPEESKYLQHLKQKHLVAPTIHAILKTDAFKCIYCNGVYTGKVTQQAVMLHMQRCRSSPKPPQAPKMVAPPVPQLAKAAAATPHSSGLVFLQMPRGVTLKTSQAKLLPNPKSPPQSKEQLESTRRLEAALKQVIEFNKKEREQKAAVRKERKELPEAPEIQANPDVKLALEPTGQDRRKYEDRRDFIARYFNVKPYLGRAETLELCRRLSLTKSEVTALFSKKRTRCMKSFKTSNAAVLLGFDMARLAQVQHPMEVPEQRPVDTREGEGQADDSEQEDQPEELPEIPATTPEPQAADDKTTAEVQMEQNN
ncbi:activity-dependent neuroprotector homeobox protein 2b [Corythoichthys intestinalis]|uniref:activity-dependent neuroprotector homeobox protein 2b n=1 Tax=Corythoichthys intestinalis TaxID=161448 RepID=UPI0025A57C12|nr:activity-dependent neuroprotector homeobox protein 2b [Corythoichthys intestinalis]XP_057683629.1 activity-dependent neuroprotector homeobox protein 2b [Corythoichthys intestinalis]XP_061808175.1 activity-dependent neuroprotective protein 2a-like [Nerophis lumbriciformis]